MKLRCTLARVLVILLGGLVWLTPEHAAAADTGWLEYERPARYEAIVTQGIRVPVRDGARLSCDLSRPGRSGVPVDRRFPGVVWQFHGYGVNRTGRDATHSGFLAERGYVVLQCSVRGTGGSPGQWDPFSPREALDGYDIVEWLAARRYTTDRVGMAGYSYGAISTYRTAALAPPHLVTIVPQSSYQDPYVDIIRLGGIRGLDARGWVKSLVPALNTAGTSPWQQAQLAQRAQEVDQEWGEHPWRDRYWRKREINIAALRESGIPILGYGGWYDIYQRGMPRNQNKLRSQSWLVMDPDAHIGGENLGTTDRGVLAWFDHWLKRIPSAPMPSAKVTSHEMPKAGGTWRTFSAWPPPRMDWEKLHLTRFGGLRFHESGRFGRSSYTVDPQDGTPSYWNTGTRPDDPVLQTWHTEHEARRVHFSTPALTKDWVLTGGPVVRVRATFSANDGNLVVRLSDVAPDGTATLVSTGWLRASHRNGHTQPARVTPGKPETYRIQVWPTHWRFAAGHKLQISISSGDVPRIDRNVPDGQVTILTGPGRSTLALPVLR